MESSTGWGGAAWFTLALVNAGLAEQKGRSRLAWFLISLLIGPIGTFLIVVFPRADALTEAWSRRDTAGTMIVAGVALLAVTGTGAALTVTWPWFVGIAAGIGLAAAGAVMLVRARRARKWTSAGD